MKTQLLTTTALAVAALVLTACGSSGGGSSESQTKIAEPALLLPSPTPSPTPVPSPTTSVTYYKLKVTRVPGGYPVDHTYDSTGACVVYKTNTYCWDDGLKGVQSFTVNSFTYPTFVSTYWKKKNGLGTCDGGCVTDQFVAPVFIDATVISAITQAAINSIFSTGTATVVGCSETASTLSCGDFTVDLTQTPL